MLSNGGHDSMAWQMFYIMPVDGHGMVTFTCWLLFLWQLARMAVLAAMVEKTAK